MKQVTLKEVAVLAGVSRGAAGKVLNNCSGDIRVSDQTRQRILDAARALNYRTNLTASMLAGGQSRLIGVLADTQALYRNRKILSEIESIAARLKYRLLVSYTHDDILSLRETCNDMRQYNVCGIICLAYDYPELRQEAAAALGNQNNIVFIEKPFFDAPHYVETSCTKALCQLVRNLKDSGRQRIGLLYGDTKYTSEYVLMQDYKKALEVNDIPFRPELTGCYPEGCSDSQACRHVVENMVLKEKPDALFIDDATFALCVQNLLLFKGWRIPEDILIVGGNGDPLFKHATPEILSLDPRYDKVAEALVNALIDPLNAENTVVESTFEGLE